MEKAKTEIHMNDQYERILDTNTPEGYFVSEIFTDKVVINEQKLNELIADRRAQGKYFWHIWLGELSTQSPQTGRLGCRPLTVQLAP